MLLTLGALMLLSAVTLTVNSMLVTKTTTMLEAEASLTAISIAQTMIDEVMTKSYDAATAGGTKIYDSTGFTAPNSLGRSATEAAAVPLPELPDTLVSYKSVAAYDDVDDYHLYKRYTYNQSMGTFTISDSIYYVAESNPDQKSSTPTYYKKIVVSVTHPNMKYPLVLSDVVVYRKYF